MALETLPKIPGRGATDERRENGVRECIGDVVDNELVLLVPLSMGGIGLGEGGSGGCWGFDGRSGEPKEVAGVSKLDKMRRVGAREGDGGFRRSHEVDLKKRIGSNKGEEQDVNTSYAEASICGLKYFRNNFRRLVHVKTLVDPELGFHLDLVNGFPPLFGVGFQLRLGVGFLLELELGSASLAVGFPPRLGVGFRLDLELDSALTSELGYLHLELLDPDLDLDFRPYPNSIFNIYIISLAYAPIFSIIEKSSIVIQWLHCSFNSNYLYK
ncbi:unnamed protein product [Prunus armeniaca]